MKKDAVKNCPTIPRKWDGKGAGERCSDCPTIPGMWDDPIIPGKWDDKGAGEVGMGTGGGK